MRAQARTQEEGVEANIETGAEANADASAGEDAKGDVNQLINESINQNQMVTAMRSEGGAEILWRATRMYGGRRRHGCRGGCLDERGLGRTSRCGSRNEGTSRHGCGDECRGGRV